MRAEAERETLIKKDMERVETGKSEETDHDDRDSGGCDSDGDGD